MKDIEIVVDRDEAVVRMREDAANYAARAELMGISGVFDVMSVMDEEVDMIKGWIDHTFNDIRLVCGRKLSSLTEDAATGKATIKLEMPDNYPDGMESALQGYLNKLLVDELLLHWMRECEAASTMKGAGAALSREMARMRDADWELWRESMMLRRRGSRKSK